MVASRRPAVGVGRALAAGCLIGTLLDRAYGGLRLMPNLRAASVTLSPSGSRQS